MITKIGDYYKLAFKLSLPSMPKPSVPTRIKQRAPRMRSYTPGAMKQSTINNKLRALDNEFAVYAQG